MNEMVEREKNPTDVTSSYVVIQIMNWIIKTELNAIWIHSTNFLSSLERISTYRFFPNQRKKYSMAKAFQESETVCRTSPSIMFGAY